MPKKSQALATRARVNIIPPKALKQADVDDRSIPTLHRALLVVPEARAVIEALLSINGRPLADRVLVLPLPNDQRYGSVMIPENSQEEQTCGLVVGVGRGRYENGALVPPDVFEGNYVAFARFAGRKVMVGNIELREVMPEDIFFAAGPNPDGSAPTRSEN
jgi:chaperonin GroES